MRKLLAVDPRRVYEHAAFIANRHFSSYTVAIVIANAVLAVFLLVLGAGQILTTWLFAPLLLALVIYKILSSIQASRIGREVNSGEAELYLAHTLTRTEYVTSVFLVVGVLPILVLLATFLMVTAIIAPSVLASLILYLQALYLSAELLAHATLALFLALSGREGLASSLGTLLALFNPLLMAMFTTYLLYAGNQNPSFYLFMYAATWMIATLSPYTYQYYHSTYMGMPFTGQSSLPDPGKVLAASIASLALCWGVIFLRFKRKDL